MKAQFSDIRIRVIIVVIATLSVLLWSFYHKPSSFPQGSDAGEYYELSLNLYENGVYGFGEPPTPSSLREPGYPIFLIITRILSGGSLGVYDVLVLQTALLILLVLLVYEIVQVLFPKTRWVTGIPFLVALSPVIAQFAGLYLSEILQMFSLLLGIFLTHRAVEEDSTVKYVLAGAIWALLIMTRLAWMPLPFLIVALILIRGIGDRKKGMIILIVPIIVLSGWVVRNHRISGEWSLNGQVGKLAYIRAVNSSFDTEKRWTYFYATVAGVAFEKNKNPTFEYNDVNGWGAYEERYAELFDEGNSESDIETILANDAKALLVAHPVRYVADGFLEIWKLHTPMLFKGNAIYSCIDPSPFTTFQGCASILLLVRIWTFIKIGLIFAGIILTLRMSFLAQMIGLSVALHTAVYFMFDSISRYALPVWPLVLILIVISVSVLMSASRKHI